MSMLKELQHLKIPLKDIETGTQNFETCIGIGGYGMVYKGQLSFHGILTTVAVKRLIEQYGQGLKEFLMEIQLLTHQNHPNLISFLGYCDEGNEKIIVYEYADRGSLDRYLNPTSIDTKYCLTWIERLKICVDAARGIEHLHNHAGKHQAIIHRDIKSSNILLAHNWAAKISDLGLSKLSLSGLNRSFVISHACGTPGYCEPEYVETGTVTKESDVYSFGMVLFEVFCGRLCFAKYDDGGFVLSARFVKDCYKKKKLDEIVDPALREQMSFESMNKFSAIAYQCLHDDRAQRPPMELVLLELEELLEMEVANHSVAIKDDTIVLECSEPDPAAFHEQVSLLFAKWYKIYELPGFNDQVTAFFVLQLQRNGLLKADDTSDRFFHHLLEVAVSHCISSEVAVQSHQQTQALSFLSIDMYASLVFSILKFSPADYGLSKMILFSKVLAVTVLAALATTFQALQPLKVPAFSFVWLELVSHRRFMPKLLSGNGQKGWPYFQCMLVDLFRFMEPFLRNGELGGPVRFLYTGTLRVLLVLLHDFPEFLCDYHFSFCDSIPPSCIQMRNIVLSAFPLNMRLPDPSMPNLEIGLLPQVSQSPNIRSGVDAALKAKQIKNYVDEYLKMRLPGTSFFSELKQKLLLSPSEAARAGTRYNVPLINSLVLYVGMHAIRKLQERNPHVQYMARYAYQRDAAFDIFQTLILELETEGRYLFLNAVANQLRYPTNHTYYFSNVLLFLYSEPNQEAIQEQIIRVLLERLIAQRPHPWGLLITFFELVKNPRYNFLSRSFIRCAPEIEKLFESMSRAFEGSTLVDEGFVAGGISDTTH